MTYINPINVNAQGVGSASGFGAKPKTETEKDEKKETAPVGAEQKPVSPDKVLNYMANSAVVTVAPKTVDPSKYVDEASAERIAGFMADFENIVASNLQAIVGEFPDMSPEAAMALALAQTEK